jgi:hypothetical protein
MGINRKQEWTEADVLCPFYISNSRDERSIRCEGYGKGVESVSRFRSLKLRDKHVGLYCAGRFERCPVYRCTYNCKYRDP